MVLLLPKDFEARFPEASKELKEIRLEGTGMSLRDWFAGLGLQGMLANGQAFDPLPGQTIAQEAVQQSYILADAMLNVRKSNG